MRCSLLTGFQSAIRNRKSAIELAEGVGFEPTRACALPVFKTGAINHSTTPPRFSFEKCATDNSLGKPRSWLSNSTLKRRSSGAVTKNGSTATYVQLNVRNEAVA